MSSSPAVAPRSSSDAEILELPVAEKGRPAPKLVSPPSAEASPGVAGPSIVEAKPKKSIVRRGVFGLVALAAISGAAYYGYNWAVLGRFQVETNDAYVKTDMSQIGAKVAGYVQDTPVAENTAVKQGDVILKLDDGDYRLALAAAQQRVATQQSLIAGFDSQLAAQQAQVAVAEAKLASAQSDVDVTDATLKRITPLVRTRVVSAQSLDDTSARSKTAIANVKAAEAGIVAAKSQLDVIAANKLQAQNALAELQTAVARAERDLSFTEIRAPFDGVVANRAVEPGQYVQAGSRLVALVPSGASYIEANFKETQLASIHPGQKAIVHVDAFDTQDYEGVVSSVSPASGAEFSLLPPENATGNFTKITQRVPVHVALPPELAAKLTPGLSVTVTVDNRDLGKAL